MFERFTEPARQVVVLAQDEARALKHNYIGTEHILLGLLRVDGFAGRALGELGVTHDGVQESVRRVVGQGDELVTGQVPFTPRAKKVLELSLLEARALGDDNIDTQHILLGLARENGGVAAQILVDLSAGAEKIFAELGRVLAKPITGNPLTPRRPGRVSIHVGSSSPWWKLAGLDPGRLFTIVAAGVGLGILIGWAIWGH